MPAFGDRVSAILRERKLRQADLARLMKRTPQYVSHIRGCHTVTVRTARAVAAALQLPLTALLPQATTSGAALDACRLALVRAGVALRASSCTLYLRDPHWVDEFVLAAMSGIRYPEPMHGVLSPIGSRHLVLDEGNEWFVEDAKADQRLWPSFPARSEIASSVRHLFGSFAQREGVGSLARLSHLDESGAKDAVWFVNFEKPQRFDEAMRRRLATTLDDILSDLPAVRAELALDQVDWLGEATRILAPSNSVANIDMNRGLDDPRQFFYRIISSSLVAFGITPDQGIGTLHFCNPEQNTLELYAQCGDIQYPERAAVHSIGKGEGVVSWVALRGRSLLISDLVGSPFRSVHMTLNRDIRSELAVPLQIAGETVGVMCLECKVPGFFQPHHVKSAWYAANRAAIAYQLHLEAALSRQILELCSRTVTGNDSPRHLLDGLATLAKRSLRSSFADIWSYDPLTRDFVLAGASYEEEQELATRNDGFSEYVRLSGRPILISDIVNTTPGAIHEWRSAPVFGSDPRKGEWQERRPGDGLPWELNPAILSQNVRCMLGVPIVVKGVCIGVAWMKYRRDRINILQPRFMDLSLGFASQAGLVLEPVQQATLRATQGPEVSVDGRHIAAQLKAKWEANASGAVISAGVASESVNAVLGGDFYGLKIVDQWTVGFILLDGEGHGVMGSLNILPLVAAFESAGPSYSAAHVISQLNATAKAVGTRATGLYGIVSQITGKRWLTIASAGHHSLILFRRDDMGRWTNRFVPTSAGAMFGHPVDEPLMDERYELASGDVLVAYTDGVAEHGASFDENQMSQVLMSKVCKEEENPGEIASEILSESRSRQGALIDDATVCVLRVR